MSKTLGIVLSVVLTLVIIASCFMMKLMSDKVIALQAKVTKYEPVFSDVVAASYGESGYVLASDVIADYERMESMYTQYGISLSERGMQSSVMLNILTEDVQNSIILDKAQYLGLDRLSDEDNENINSAAEKALSKYIDRYTEYFYPKREQTEDMRLEAIAYWAAQGIDTDYLTRTASVSVKTEKVRQSVISGIAVSDTDVRERFDSLVSAQQNSYGSDPDAYIADFMDGERIVWSPEGFRCVKRIMLPLDSDSQSRLSELDSTLEALNEELASVTADTRSADQINADILSCSTERDAIYADLEDRAAEIIASVRAGEPFETVFSKNNDDSVINPDNDVSFVYPVALGNTYWEQSFTDAAMSMTDVGDLTTARISNGVCIILYDHDITPGTADFNAISNDLQADTLSTLQNDAWKQYVDDLVEKAAPVYYYENVGLSEADLVANGGK